MRKKKTQFGAKVDHAAEKMKNMCEEYKMKGMEY